MPPSKFIWTPLFEKDFRGLPKELQARTEKALHLLLQDPRHPSLRARKMQGLDDIWEARVSIAYRITYQLAGDTIILRRLGSHDILRKQ
ncbi:MAG TPA: type II toxin-antitoxin system RelE/ParE family toxin [Terriglobia bacterium]|jgi:mRNA interferase RelE/StbE|nr:type II toxin-antitoxin system RelE/ParE family toxin [Terriglobia bacterium]